MHLVDWSSFIDGERDATEAEKAAGRDAWSAARLKSAVAIGNSGDAAPPGEARVAAIRRCLDRFEGFPRSDAQRRFHEVRANALQELRRRDRQLISTRLPSQEFIRSCLPHIFGSADFERHRDRILAAHQMTKVSYDCLICTPRRFGKNLSIRALPPLYICTHSGIV